MIYLFIFTLVYIYVYIYIFFFSFFFFIHACQSPTSKCQLSLRNWEFLLGKNHMELANAQSLLANSQTSLNYHGDRQAHTQYWFPPCHNFETIRKPISIQPIQLGTKRNPREVKRDSKRTDVHFHHAFHGDCVYSARILQNGDT